jgi:hypothetical protein
MKQIRSLIHKNATGKKVAILFSLTSVVLGIMMLVTVPKTMAYANGLELLDLMPGGYDMVYVTNLLTTLGEKGRTVYLHYQIPVDMVYPFLFGISNCLLLTFLLKKLDKYNTAFFYLCLLPIVTGIADYLENIGIISMLTNYPYLSDSTVVMTNLCTITKGIAGAVYFLSLLAVLILFKIKKN